MSTQSCPVSHSPEAVIDGLPPGPRLPRTLQSILVWGFRPATQRRWRARYGDMFTVRDRVTGDIVVLSDPDHVKQVFAGNPRIFRAGEGNAVLGPVLGDRSVLLIDGELHRRRRKIMLPAFHGEQVRRQESLIREVVDAELDEWPVGTPFASHPLTRKLTLEVILRTVLGVREPARLELARAALPVVADLTPKMMLMWMFPSLGRIGPWRRYWQRKREADELLDEEIALRVADPELADRSDVLSALVRAYQAAGDPTDDGDLREQLITLLIAGHETTATGLAWCLDLLAHNPCALATLRESLAAGETDYLGAVVTETLRVRPVVPSVARRLTEPVTLGGYRLPAGTVVLPGIALVHHNAAVHAEPRRFRPERWLGSAAAAQGMVLPFGGGVRRCLGAPFAVAELNLAVEAIVRRFDIAPVEPRTDGARAKHVTLVPANGARILLTPRG
jgi:cytochrome P450